MATIPCSDGNQSVLVRALVVDDFEPFRRFVCTMLGSRPELQVIGEASDGLQAVQKAEESQPDLILLDIGLPTLNGIEAAHRISRLVPAARILFVSQENDSDVVAAVLSNGAIRIPSQAECKFRTSTRSRGRLAGDRFVSEGLISET